MSRLINSTLIRMLLPFVAAALIGAATLQALAAGPAGNNGTVKVHSGPEGTEPLPELRNEPHVACPFHLHFYFADTEQSGWWRIEPQAPGAEGPNAAGTYDTGPLTTASTGDVFLGAGHWKLDWSGRDDQNVKHKTFWVDGDCGGGGGGGG